MHIEYSGNLLGDIILTGGLRISMSEQAIPYNNQSQKEAADGEQYLQRWKAMGEDKDGIEYTVRWVFEVIKGDEQDDDELQWDEVSTITDDEGEVVYDCDSPGDAGYIDADAIGKAIQEALLHSSILCQPEGGDWVYAELTVHKGKPVITINKRSPESTYRARYQVEVSLPHDSPLLASWDGEELDADGVETACDQWIEECLDDWASDLANQIIVNR